MRQWIEGPLRRAEQFELHAFKVFRMAGERDVNSWMRCKTASLATSNQPIVLVEQDLNTLQERAEEEQFNIDYIRQFFVDCQPELDRILNLYFPNA